MESMSINEFKAFLEGMDVRVAPEAPQWKRIREKIDLLEQSPAINLSTPFPSPFNTGDMPGTFPYTTCVAN